MVRMMIHKEKEMASNLGIAGGKHCEILFFCPYLSTIVIKKPTSYFNTFDGVNIQTNTEPADCRVFRIEKIGPTSAHPIWLEIDVTEIARYPIRKPNNGYKTHLRNFLEETHGTRNANLTILSFVDIHR